MKKQVKIAIGAAAVLLIGLIGFCAWFLSGVGSAEYYSKIDNSKIEQVDSKGGVINLKGSLPYAYTLLCYDENGGEKEITFGTSRELRVIWENVMGALLSGNRLDFRAVLQSLTDAEIPMPASGRWANAGMVRGGGRDVCWRLLDAQHWADPRLARRQRVFVVADFGGRRAGAVLFKPRRLFPPPAPCGDFGLSPAGADRSHGDVPQGKPLSD